MNEDTRVITGTTLVALAGGLLAYLVFTNRGRATLHGVTAALDDVSHALQEIRTIAGKIQEVVREGEHVVSDVRTAFPSLASATDYPPDAPLGV